MQDTLPPIFNKQTANSEVFYQFNANSDQTIKESDSFYTNVVKAGALGLTTLELNQSLYLANKNHEYKRKSAKVDKVYTCLFSRFVNEWSNTHSSTLIQNYPVDPKFCINLQDQKPSKFFIPDISMQLSEISDISGDRCTYFLSIISALKDIYNNGFRSVTLQLFEWMHLVEFGNSNLLKCSQRRGYNRTFTRGNNFLNLTVLIEEFNLSLLDVARMESYAAPFLKYFGLNPPKYSCFINVQFSSIEYAQLISEMCDEISLELKIRLNLVGPSNYIYFSFLQYIPEYFMGTSMIKTRWPNKSIGVTGIALYEISDTIFRRGSLYCNPIFVTYSQYFDVIFSLGDMYEIPFTQYKSMLRNNHLSNLIKWERIYELGDHSKGLNAEFPLYLRRSYSDTSVFRRWNKGTFACLDWLTEVSVETGFVAEQCGTYFKLNLRQNTIALKETEVFVMLLFSLATFRMTEINIETPIELYLIFGIVTSHDFKQRMFENSIVRRDLFLNIWLTRGKTPRGFFRTIDKLFAKTIISNQELSIRIHFSNLLTTDLANSIMEHYGSSEGFQLPKVVDIGIQINDCKEVINVFARIKEYNKINLVLDKNTTAKLLEMFSYIVCRIPGMVELDPSKSKMQTYFQTHYYMKTLLQFLFPNLKQVYFSMKQTHLSDIKDIKNVLLLYRQTAQFGSIYNIPYFLMPGFKQEKSGDISWWEIQNYSNLENTRVFADIHSTYLQKESWRPILIQPENSHIFTKKLDNDSEKFLTYGLAGTCVLILSAVAVLLVVIKMKRNVIFLSDDEVQQFENGRQENANLTNDLDNHNRQVENHQYNSEHEISISDISLQRDQILGVGTFGIVYQANLKSAQEQTVAVKTPREGCDRQTFIGMLREVKLLSYLGNHQNIVQFIGCYTKEIQRGILYIALELCSGGSLLSHLRRLKSNQCQIGQEGIVTDLICFSRDIASGMKYISGKDIIHGDLSARNILLDELKICKISDFGLSRKLYQYKTYSKKSQEPLPWRWMSYESLKNMEFSAKSDVWSFGITLWEVFSLGDVPYPGQGWTVAFVTELKKGMRMLAPEYAMIEIYEKMAECWILEPEQRPNFTELFQFFVDLLPYTDLS